MTNEQNFKKGDRVAAEDAKYSGIVTTVCDTGCKVHFADGEELFFLNELLHHSDLPDYDRKTAFLTRLQSLLREYDASFEFYDVYDMEIRIGEESVEYGFLNKENSPSLTADNIMDFDEN